MSATLTDQQRQALHEANDAGPVTVIDPATNAEYILVRADIYAQMREWLNDLEPQEAYPLVDRIMADDDAQDPTLASYQNASLFRGIA
jgi:DNA-directed RNA polymerase sigma subunit (sigma70/sigma32)